MNIIDLLPDHPEAPQRHSFKTVLPNLIDRVFVRSFKLKAVIVGYLDNSCGYEALQCACKSLDITVSWIDYQVEMIRHDDKHDQLTGPVA